MASSVSNDETSCLHQAIGNAKISRHAIEINLLVAEQVAKDHIADI